MSSKAAVRRRIAELNGIRTPETLTEAFTKQHYIAIAKVIKEARDESERGGNSVADHITQELAKLFANDNPQFDKARFMAACG